MIAADLKKKLKAKAKLMEPVARIGKNGITDSMVAHIMMLLKKRQLVKVKLLKSFADTHDRKKVAEDIAEKTGAELVELIGSNITLYRQKQKTLR